MPWTDVAFSEANWAIAGIDVVIIAIITQAMIVDNMMADFLIAVTKSSKRNFSWQRLK